MHCHKAFVNKADTSGNTGERGFNSVIHGTFYQIRPLVSFYVRAHRAAKPKDVFDNRRESSTLS